MKILIATGLYPPEIGGPATYTVFLEKHMPRFGILLTTVPFTWVRHYPRLLRHFVYLWKLIQNSKDCDVLYALDTVSVGMPALIASVIMQKPLLLRVPGDYAWEQGQQRFGITETLDTYRTHDNHPLPVRFLAWVQYLVARHADHVIVPSDYMKELVTGWGVDPKRITRIYSGLEPLPQNSQPRLPNAQTFVITTAARLVPWKGVDALLRVVHQARERGLPFELLIIGDGVMKEKLVTQAEELGVSSSVHFTGSLSRTDLGAKLSASDVFVLNTSYEGLSHQIIEVMNLGIPVITTPVGGNKELIVHEETGLMVPFNDEEAILDALVRLYEDRALGATLVQKAKIKVEAFRESVVIEEYVALMRSLWK